MHSMGYQIALPCSLSRYATSAENHGGQMQHNEGGVLKGYYSEVSNLGDRNRSETGMNTGHAVVQIADF